MSMQALRERLSALNKDSRQLLAEKGSATWSIEDQTKFDGLMDEAERTQTQLNAHERMLNQQAEDNFKDAPRNAPNKKKSESQEGVELFLRKLAKDLSQEESLKIRNAMSTTTGSEGGFTVQPEVSKRLIEAMKDYGGMRRVATAITTANGADLSYPGTDGTSEIGEIVAQNASASVADTAFTTVPLNTFKFGSRVFAVPIELLQDSTVDVVALIENRLRDRIGRIANQMFTTGTGTGQPFGMVPRSGVGKVGTTGQTTTITYDDLVDIVDSMDVAYQNDSMKFMFGQAMRRGIRKIKDTAGRPIWTPSYESGITQKQPDLLLGYSVEINNDMPAAAANAKSLAFGDLAQYTIRDAMQVTLFRFEDSAFLTKGQIGFLGWSRHGGNLLDTNAVRVYQHSAT